MTGEERWQLKLAVSRARRERIERERIMIGQCGWCDGPMEPGRVNPRKYCSDVCRKRASEFRRGRYAA